MIPMHESVALLFIFRGATSRRGRDSRRHRARSAGQSTRTGPRSGPSATPSPRAGGQSLYVRYGRQSAKAKATRFALVHHMEGANRGPPDAPGPRAVPAKRGETPGEPPAAATKL